MQVENHLFESTGKSKNTYIVSKVRVCSDHVKHEGQGIVKESNFFLGNHGKVWEIGSSSKEIKELCNLYSFKIEALILSYWTEHKGIEWQ